MHMRRFFVEKEHINGNRVTISGQDALHITESLRLRVRDTILVLDGCGMEYDVTLEKLSDRSVQGKVVRCRECERKVGVQIGLFQALPKGARKLNFVLQRGTEIGLSEIGFFSSGRSVPRIRGSERQEEKSKRWRRIATEAAKQCRRVTLPEIRLFGGLREVLDYCRGYDLFLIAWEGEEHTRLRDALKGAEGVDRVALITGPEGGFEREEVRLAERHGAKVFSLGKLILRSEFAGIVAASMVLYEFGELG